MLRTIWLICWSITTVKVFNNKKTGLSIFTRILNSATPDLQEKPYTSLRSDSMLCDINILTLLHRGSLAVVMLQCLTLEGGMDYCLLIWS